MPMATVWVPADKLTRQQCVSMAKLAEKAERYEDMIYFVDKLVTGWTPAGELGTEEQNLVFVAYKKVMDSLRFAWRRIVSSFQHMEDYDVRAMVEHYRFKVEFELAEVTANILMLLESNLMPSARTSESKVFYLKLKGDFCRYAAEFKTGEERKAAVEDAKNAYKAAQEIAVKDLAPMNVTRLTLALNFSVFYYAILNSPDQAATLARQALQEAFAQIASTNEEEYNDSTIIMQLIKNNLALWDEYRVQEEQEQEP